MNNIVTIHQPDFMPWLGYFHKVQKSDYLVVLDHVEMDVKNSGWIKRVKHLINGEANWVTIPLKRPVTGHMQPIHDIKIDTSNKAYLKASRILKNIYSKHPYYKTYKYLIEDYFDNDSKFVAERNFNFICQIFELLKLKPEIFKSSTMALQATKSEMNAEIVEKVGGQVYYSGKGAIEYQNENDFIKRNLKLRISSFDPKTVCYQQLGSNQFIPGLSVLDAIMNIGEDATKKLIEK